jgi:hypothetical protein
VRGGEELLAFSLIFCLSLLNWRGERIQNCVDQANQSTQMLKRIKRYENCGAQTVLFGKPP